MSKKIEGQIEIWNESQPPSDGLWASPDAFANIRVKGVEYQNDVDNAVWRNWLDMDEALSYHEMDLLIASHGARYEFLASIKAVPEPKGAEAKAEDAAKSLLDALFGGAK